MRTLMLHAIAAVGVVHAIAIGARVVRHFALQWPYMLLLLLLLRAHALVVGREGRGAPVEGAPTSLLVAVPAVDVALKAGASPWPDEAACMRMGTPQPCCSLQGLPVERGSRVSCSKHAKKGWLRSPHLRGVAPSAWPGGAVAAARGAHRCRLRSLLLGGAARSWRHARTLLLAAWTSSTGADATEVTRPARRPVGHVSLHRLRALRAAAAPTHQPAGTPTNTTWLQEAVPGCMHSDREDACTMQRAKAVPAAKSQARCSASSLSDSSLCFAYLLGRTSSLGMGPRLGAGAPSPTLAA